MARTNECSHVSWAAAEVRLDKAYKTGFLYTEFVANQISRCVHEGRVKTTPSLLTAVREFKRNENLPFKEVLAFLLKLQTVFICMAAGIPLSPMAKYGLARFLDILHHHLPEWELDVPVYQPAFVLQLDEAA